jgi:uncharacterized membrane protein YfcA
MLAMAVGPLRDVLTAALGFLTGMASALFGVGGAIVSTPGIRALGVSALLAIGTTLPSIIPGAASGTYRYARQHLIEWRVVGIAGSIGAAISIVGALVTKHVPGHGHFQQILTAALLGYVATNMLRALRRSRQGGATPVPQEGTTMSTPVVALIGGFTGFLSGFLGIGGGIFMVSGFMQFGRLTIKRSIATSLACVCLFAIPSTITHWTEGGIDWRTALWLTVMVIPGSLVGTKITAKANDAMLQAAVAIFIALIAVVYFASEVIAL